MFMSVSRYHPRMTLGMEMRALSLVWEARIRCMISWCKIMCTPVYEGRLLKRIALEALEKGGGGLERQGHVLGILDGRTISGESLEGMTKDELKDVLRGFAWGRVTEEWGRDLQGKPKLDILKSLYENEYADSAVHVCLTRCTGQSWLS